MKIPTSFSSLRELPEKQRKIILWIATGILGVILFGWWIYSIKQQIPTIQDSARQDIPFSELQESLDEVPDVNDANRETSSPEEAEE